MEWAAGALGLMQSGFGIFGARSQRRANRARTQLSFESNKEDIRRREYEIDQTIGAAKALTETAGVRHSAGSTAQGVLDEMSDQYRKELSWMREYAFRAKQLGMKQAKLDYSASIMNSITGGVNALSMFGRE